VGPEAVHRLHRTAKAQRWGVTPDRFAAVLESSLSHAFPDGATAPAAERHLASLHLEDLALATACADGHEAAWEHFIREHRPVLYRSADAIDRTGGAREAADALYAELFGLTERDGERRSLFRYFHGRSSLATWLRAVLSQRYVDGLRRTRRLESLPTDDEATALPAREDVAPPDRPRFVEVLQRALTAAMARLEPRDRLRLACYYAQDLTLAQIGRTLREHEATSSRNLARTRRAIRKDVEQQLRHSGMSEAEVAECFATVSADAGPLDLNEILPEERRSGVPGDREERRSGVPGDPGPRKK
jgi:RNA polymerase sigma-70 factor, ECF subfamily